VRPQTLIIALLLTVTIFVPPVYIAHASVALNQTVPVLQEAVLKRMCAVYVTEMGRPVLTVQEHQTVLPKMMHVAFVMEMGQLALTVQENQTATLLKMLVACAVETAQLVWIALVFQMEIQKRTSVEYVVEMAALALFVMRTIQ